MKVAGPAVQVRPWTILAHIDATASDISNWEVADAITLQNQKDPNTAVVAHVRRDPPNRLILGALGVLELLPIAASVGFLAAAAMSTGVLPILGLGACGLVEGGLGAIVAKDGIKRIKRAWNGGDGTLHGERWWRGSREYDLTAARPGTNQLNGTIVSKSWSTRAPDAARLLQSIVQTAQRYPSTRRALLIQGHGEAWKGAGGISTETLSTALREQKRYTGEKVDLVVFNSCVMGNIEALAPLADGARYAVVSEEVVYTGNKMPSILAHNLSYRPSAGAVGTDLVQAAGTSDLPTSSLIDLQHLPPLQQSLERLATVLMEAGGRGHKKAIMRALRSKEGQMPNDSDAFDFAWGLRDIGALLGPLGRVNDAQVKAAVVDAQRHLAKAVVRHKHKEDYNDMASGLSIQVQAPFMSARKYGQETGMKQWGRMLQTMRPWPSRLFHAAWDQVRRIV